MCQSATAAVTLCNKSSPNLVVYNSEHNSGFAKVALFRAATWWSLVPGFGIHGPHFELQASHLQRGSHYGAQAEGAEAT